MKANRISRILATPFRRPSLLAIAALASGILYALNKQASIYDIKDPKWVVSMAGFILLSPLFNGVFIAFVRRSAPKQSTALKQAWNSTLEAYPRLMLAGVLVNLAVVAALFLFVLPGIYLGLRLSFYKQVLLIERGTILDGIRKSLQRTRGWRMPLRLLFSLSPFYGLLALGASLETRYPIGALGDALILILSALTFAWTNVLLTDLYVSGEEMPIPSR
jgi:hypothetical protein